MKFLDKYLCTLCPERVLVGKLHSVDGTLPHIYSHSGDQENRACKFCTLLSNRRKLNPSLMRPKVICFPCSCYMSFCNTKVCPCHPSCLIQRFSWSVVSQQVVCIERVSRPYSSQYATGHQEPLCTPVLKSTSQKRREMRLWVTLLMVNFQASRDWIQSNLTSLFQGDMNKMQTS